MNFQDAKDEIVKWLVPGLLAMVWTEQRANTLAIQEVAKAQSGLIARVDYSEKRIGEQRTLMISIQDVQSARTERLAKLENDSTRSSRRLETLEVKIFGRPLNL